MLLTPSQQETNSKISFYYYYHYFIEMESHHVAQAGLELPGSSDPPASASESAGIKEMNHCDWPQRFFTDNK
uniref:Uncharacterized protein n=1 Tax=Piliocolobus tephrosceles TaxID=591936 RepID=A0A8C9LRQ0_9PRIM